ncbi:Uncharacterised protein [Mycobacteroides abscessus subsp. abscessus]|nr:Uncharacterised protein [Mycobacteroides abscessus subsp. abscessus]
MTGRDVDAELRRNDDLGQRDARRPVRVQNLVHGRVLGVEFDAQPLGAVRLLIHVDYEDA